MVWTNKKRGLIFYIGFRGPELPMPPIFRNEPTLKNNVNARFIPLVAFLKVFRFQNPNDKTDAFYLYVLENLLLHRHDSVLIRF